MNKNSYRKKLFNRLSELYLRINSLGKKIQKKILFNSFDGKQYSCNPRAISEKMHELYPDFEIVWYLRTVDKYNILPKYVRTVSSYKDFLKEMATSFCVVTNKQFEEGVYKRKRQLFIQTWHGDIGFKRILYDAWESIDNSVGEPVPIIDNKVTDYCVAGSDLGETVYRSAFRYHGNILKYGMPRNDKLNICNQEYVNNIKKQLGIDESHCIVLYAPTFRDGQKGAQKTSIDLDNIVKTLNKRTGKKWIGLIRAHVGFKIEYDSNDSILNVTDYPDMADLLMASDFLITDYSASAGDYAITKRPLILALFDYDDYKSCCRSFKVDPKESGFIYAEDQKTLEEKIETLNLSDYEHASQSVIKKFGIIQNSNSSKIICDTIYKRYEEISKVR